MADGSPRREGRAMSVRVVPARVLRKGDRIRYVTRLGGGQVARVKCVSDRIRFGRGMRACPPQRVLTLAAERPRGASFRLVRVPADRQVELLTDDEPYSRESACLPE